MEEELIDTRDAFEEILTELGRENKDIVVLSADVAECSGVKRFIREFPERFFNVGIAEQNMMGIAAGLARCGKVPIVTTFAVFASGRAWEQVRNTISHSHLNVKIIATHGGITIGEDGSSHQGNEDIALMRVIPGMQVIVPADGIETKKAIQLSITEKGPFYIRLGRGKVPIVLPEDYPFHIGKAGRIRRGEDVSIFACGIMLYHSLRAEEELRKEGISVDVINISTIKPIDKETIIDSARSTEAVVIAEEHQIIGGLGSAVAEVLIENCPVPGERIGIKDTFGESGTAEDLLEKYELTRDHICRAVKRVIQRKSGTK